MRKLWSTSILKSPTRLVLANPTKSSTTRHASSIALDGLRREAKGKGVDEGWQSMLKGLERKWNIDYKSYHRSGSRLHRSRVVTLLERRTRFEFVQERKRNSRNAAVNALREAIEFDGAEKLFPQDVHPIYTHILQGKEEIAWDMFRQVLSKGQQASIWHWYIMIGLAARDKTVSIKDLFKMAWHTKSVPYTNSAIHQSLKDPNELGGIIGQQRVLAFTMMHNLQKRMTEEAYRAVISVWTSLRMKKITPTSRHVNAMCVSLIHMGRQDEAMKRLFEKMKPITAGPYREDPQGWLTSRQGEGAQMNQYTVGMMMYAFLLEGYPKRAYEMYKASINEAYSVPVHNVPLNLLLWAGRQSYQSIASCKAAEEEEVEIFEEDKPGDEGLVTRDIGHWRSQAIWDGHPSSIQVRHIFETYLFQRYPELKDVANPLYESRIEDHSGFLWKTHARMQRWSQKLEDIIAPLLQWETGQKDATLLTVSTDDNLAEEAKLKVDEITFNYYLELLPFVSIFEEVPWEKYILVLGWMRHLDITPGHYCLLRICWAVDHLIPPVAEFASCAGPLHDYLADWIGEDSIPTRVEMDAFERRQKY